MDGGAAFSGFHRASVADQAAGALRDLIGGAAWGSSLPGEHEIARRLGIGRYSVRAALAQLAKQGLVEISKGRRPRLRHNLPAESTPARPAVCIVAPDSLERLDLRDHPVLMEVRAQLAEHGITWEEIFDGQLGGKRPERRLARLVEARRDICWLLLCSSAPLQRWFELAAVPTLILGSPHPGVRLPSVDTDYRAVGWHAAGRMAQYGHRRLGIILPDRLAAGDVACWRGMKSYVEQHAATMTLAEVACGSHPSILQGKLKRLMLGRERPTAILSILPKNALTTYCHLLRSGFKIPADLSLVASDNHALFDISLPELTCYRLPTAKQARGILQAVRKVLAGHALPPRASMILPTFVPGSTLGPLSPGRGLTQPWAGRARI